MSYPFKYDILVIGSLNADLVVRAQHFPRPGETISGVSHGNTFADLMKVSKKPVNMKVAMDVRGRDFIELFVERMEALSRRIS